MKFIDNTCPYCGAKLKIDLKAMQAVCEHCGAELIIDDDDDVLTPEEAEEAGYLFEKGRQRARAEAGRESARTLPQGNEAVRAGHPGWMSQIPGFRTNTLWKKAVAFLGYFLILGIALSYERNGMSTPRLWLNRICMAMAMFSIVDMLAGGTKLARSVPGVTGSNVVIRLLARVFAAFVSFAFWIILCTVMEMFIR